MTITDTTRGAEIFYTTNGAKPTKSSIHYTKPFSITKDETIIAVAFATGDDRSVPSKAANFTIKAATPKLSEPTGKYSKAISVTITDATKGAVIYYTTNSAAPTTKSTRYTKAITVSKSETVKAIAVAPGGSPSGIAVASYTIKTKPAIADAAADTAKER